MSLRIPASISNDTLPTSRARLPEKIRFRRIHSPLVWWHLLSLDAPTVAVVWCWFLGAIFHVKFPWETLPTLALGTWCVYVADRLLDGWRSNDTAALRDRHWFYLRHRALFVAAWILAAIPLAYLIFFRISPVVRTDDIILCLIGIAYFILIHSGRKFAKSSLLTAWFPKELAVGFLFAIATAVPAWTRLASSANAPFSTRMVFLASVFIFGTICWLNCVAIQTWEDNEADHEIVHAILSNNRTSTSARSFGGLTAHLGKYLLAFAAAVIILSLAFLISIAKSPYYPIFSAVSISGGIFAFLVYLSRRCSALSLHIAADGALLTPLLFIFFTHW